MRRPKKVAKPFRSRAPVTVCVLLAQAPLVAGNLTVQDFTDGGNVNSGSFAALLTIDSTSCVSASHLAVPGPIATDTYEGCSSVTSDGDAVADAAVVFRSGHTVTLQSGFSVPVGATLTVQIDSSIFPDAYLQDDTPEGETVYAARFYVDAGDLSMTGTDRFHHFEGLGREDAPQARVGVKWATAAGGGLRLFLEAFEDGVGLPQSTEGGADELVLPAAGWHWVEIEWQAADAGSSNGRARLCLDGVCSSWLDNLDNGLATIERIRWGALDVAPGSAFGQMDLDDFDSRRSLNIGPLPP